MKRRSALTILTFVFGVIAAPVAIYIGWQLPHREECNGGDACVSTLEIDWSRVDWGIPPKRLACGVPNPGPGNVLIGPGAICITADGLGNVLEKTTYEEMRARAALRRIVTLGVIGFLVVIVPLAVAWREHRRALNSISRAARAAR